MGVSVVLSMMMGIIEAKYICNVIFYVLGFTKRDKKVCRWLGLGEYVEGSTSFYIDIAMCIGMYLIYTFMLHVANVDKIEIPEITILTFYMAVILSVIVRFIQAIKDKMYKNRQYNKISETIDKIDVLVDSIRVGRNEFESINDKNKGKSQVLYDLHETLQKIRAELVYNKSISGLYTVVNISNELNKCNANSENISALIREVDKLNAYNELSNSQLKSLYETLRNQVIAN